MVRDAQVRLLRRKLMEGKTQEGAAAAAGISARSARRWKKGPYPSQGSKPHTWRIASAIPAGLWESRSN